MSVKAASNRTTAQVKKEFRRRGIAIYPFSRRNIIRLSSPQYDRLKTLAWNIGVTRLIVPPTISKVDLAQMPDGVLEGCVKSRKIMPGLALDLRKLPSSVRQAKRTRLQKALSWVKSLYLKLLMVFYWAWVRVKKAKLNVIQYLNRSGEKLVAIVDYPEGDQKDREIPWVIIPPAFGKRKETYFLLALYLKKNGFGVVRYDDSHSLGESDGEIRDLTLSRSTENIIATVDFLSRLLKVKTIGLIPFSLSASAQRNLGEGTYPATAALTYEDSYGETYIEEFTVEVSVSKSTAQFTQTQGDTSDTLDLFRIFFLAALAVIVGGGLISLLKVYRGRKRI